MRDLFEYMNYHKTWNSPDLTPAENAIETVFKSNNIRTTHINTIYGTSVARFEYRLDDLKAYDKVAKIESQFKALFDNENAVLTKDGAVVAIEIPVNGGTLYLGDMFKSKSFIDSSRFTVAIGRSTRGKDVYADMEDLKHILIAGTTGSGKSIFMHNLILSIIAKHTNNADVYIIDPKMSEFSDYSASPCCHVVTTAADAVSLLSNLCTIMDERYRIFANAGCRDIVAYNDKNEPMKRIFLFTDELGDLMKSSHRKTAENYIVRLAQKARACGIHLVLATQYPKSDIVTGTIKQNMPTKICFATTSNTGSIVMLDRKGAERLVGKGDMLYQTEKDIKPSRLQAAYANDNDRAVVILYSRGYDFERRD